MSAPHLNAPVRAALRRGAFWIIGATELVDGQTSISEAMYVEWEAPAESRGLPPLVLVHGGGGQGTDWTVTPDGRPAWRDLLVDAGYPVYVVDRPGHGRASHHPSDGVGGAPSIEIVGMIFAPDGAPAQTQWPWRRDNDGKELLQLAAAQGPIPADAAQAQARDSRCVAALLDRLGNAILITHSAGAPAGWLAAQARPERVLGIAAIEPMGPPFVDMPGFGSLTWGITAAPLHADPTAADPGEISSDAFRALPGLTGLPVLVVTGSASAAAPGAAAVAGFLRSHGAEAQLLALENVGTVGNGHGLMFEANNDQTLLAVLGWIEKVGGRP